MIKDVYAGATSSSPGNFLDLNGTLLFSASGASYGNEFWKTDGTSSGTVIVKDIIAG